MAFVWNFWTPNNVDDEYGRNTSWTCPNNYVLNRMEQKSIEKLNWRVTIHSKFMCHGLLFFVFFLFFCVKSFVNIFFVDASSQGICTGFWFKLTFLESEPFKSLYNYNSKQSKNCFYLLYQRVTRQLFKTIGPFFRPKPSNASNSLSLICFIESSSPIKCITC